MKLSRFSWVTFLLINASWFSSCQNSDTVPAFSKSSAFIYPNLPADVGTSRDSQGNVIGATGHFTFFTFTTGQIIELKDSNSTKWDIAFRDKTIIFNSSTSGPGTTQAQLLNVKFDDLTQAPEAGYRTDNDSSPIDPDPNFKLAIVTGVNNGWYTADNSIVKPLSSKVIVVKTTALRYVKMEILSFYKNSPASPSPLTDLNRFYTFRYSYQADGSRDF